MRKCFMFILVTVFLLTSCTNNNIATTMKNLESDNQQLQEQVEALTKENLNLKNENTNLVKEAKEKDSKIHTLISQIKLFQKGQYFNSEDIKNEKVLDVDLNNDGNKEIIKLQCTDTKYYRLTINDVAVTSVGINVDSDFKVVDINIGDNIKEIAVSEWGVNNDPKTSFYIYCPDNIVHIGKIKGHINEIDRSGDGSLTTNAIGNILCSWYYRDEYKLSNTHMIVNEPRELYEINYRVKVLKSIPILKSTTETEMVAALTVGEEVTILSSDNKKWCQVQKENGVKGWFEIEGFDKIKGTSYTANDVFEGLHIDK